MRLTLRHLEHFSAVAQTGSISAAATRQRVSRTSITEAMDTLERITQTVLCERSRSHGVVLTTAGQDFLQRSHQLLTAAQALEVTDDDRRLTGTLTLGCFRSLAPTAVPLLWDQFADRHPDVTVAVATGSRRDLLDRLALGTIDVLIAYNLHALPGVQTAALYDTAIYALLPADHRLARAGAAPVLELAHEPLLLMDVPPSSEDVLSYFAHHGVTPTVRLTSPDFELIRSLVARGLGYSLFIQRPQQDLSYEGLPVACVPLDPPPHLERAGIGWSDRRLLPAPGRAFVDLALEYAEQIRPRPLDARA